MKDRHIKKRQELDWNEQIQTNNCKTLTTCSPLTSWILLIGNKEEKNRERCKCKRKNEEI